MRLVKSFDALLQENNLQNAIPGQTITGDYVVQALQEELSKAMSYDVIPGGTNIGPLKLENLDSVMTQVLYDERHLKIFNAIPRVPTLNQLYQYNRRLSYGGGRRTTGFVEGGMPSGGTSRYSRATATVRYKGVKGGYTHQVMTTGLNGGLALNPMEEEQRNRTLELLSSLEREIVFGREDILDADGNTINYDGFLKQMGSLAVGTGTAAPSNVYDMAGAVLDFSILERIAERLYTQAYVGSIDGHLCFTSPGVLTDLSLVRFNNSGRDIERRVLGSDPVAPLVPGEPIAGFSTNYGTYRFEPSLFLERVPGNRPLLAANAEAEMQVADTGAPASPAAPTMVAANDSTSKLPASTAFYYVASAINADGESLGVVSAASVTTAASPAQKVTVTIPRVNAATHYRLYRTNAAPAVPGAIAGGDSTGVNARWIADVPQPGSGDASFVDLNQIIPGTGMMLLIRPAAEDICMPQLSPLIKYPLAVVSTKIEFLLMLYHTFVVKAKERHVVIKNIGRAS